MDNDYIIFISSSFQTYVNCSDDISVIAVSKQVDTIMKCFNTAIRFRDHGIYLGYRVTRGIAKPIGTFRGYVPPYTWGFADPEHLEDLYERYQGLREKATERIDYPSCDDLSRVVLGYDFDITMHEKGIEVSQRGLNSEEIDLLVALHQDNGFERFIPKQE